MRAFILAALLALATVGPVLADDDAGSDYRPAAPAITFDVGAPQR